MIRLFSYSPPALGLCLLVLLTLAARCSNRSDILIDGRVYFVDADCYSRMTRVRMILERPGMIIRHHDFENYPQGITPHTTAPLDFLIVTLKGILDWCGLPARWAAQTPDLAGASVSPLLGVLTLLFLWEWSRRLKIAGRGMMLFLFAVSPILAHGTMFGRPDHQSLLIFLMAVALGAEWAMLQTPAARWAALGGAAWGLGLWVSFYEPLILLTAILGLHLIFGPHRFLRRERLISFGLMAGIASISVAIEGWRTALPETAHLRYFSGWEKNIGELNSLPPLSPLLFRWTGLLLLGAPVLLAMRHRKDKRALPALLLLGAVYGLTLWQMRWGYFFALLFAMLLPFALEVFRRRSVAWTLFFACLWPVAREWDERLFPSDAAQERNAGQKFDQVCLRDLAAQGEPDKPLPMLAPWWFSPALAYWSRQPCVAGSSHESLSGIVDSARFYLAENPADARAILQSRGVKRVVAYDARRTAQTAATLLGVPEPATPLSKILFERPHSAPAFLKLIYANPAFKLFAVE